MDELKQIAADLPALLAKAETLEELASIKAKSDAAFAVRYRVLVDEDRGNAKRKAAEAELAAAQKKLAELGGA